MPRIRKKTSKRGTTHQRTKIRQKVRETHKKRKRDGKTNVQWKSKHKKDPGIPASLPFKEDILAEIEATRRQAEEDKQRRKEKQPATPTPASNPTSSVSAPPNSDSESDEDPPILIDSSLPNLGAVIDSVHAVLYVLDARDPQTFRSTRLEGVLASKDKRLVIVLAKSDLVPREVLAGWIAYLHEQFPATPVVPFRASEEAVPSSEGNQEPSLDSVFRKNLMTALTEACKSITDKDPRIAVVGLTNSGKSTLINSLANITSLPTYIPSIQQPKKATFQTTTEGAQPVQCGSFKFIDTPGLGFVQFNARSGGRKLTPDEVETSKARDLLLRNRGSFVHWKETDAAAAYIVSRANSQDLMLHYNVPAFTPGDVPAFLGGVARASGRIRKHGVPDLADTARSISRDWSLGRLPYFALPPSSAVVVSTDPTLDVCMTLKEARAAPRAWPVQLDAGTPDERDVDLEALYAVQGAESVARRKEEQMEVDEDEEDESGEEDEEDEEMESDASSSSEEPAPKSKKVSFNTQPQPRTKPKTVPTKLKPASKPIPAPRRIGNLGKAKPKVVSVAGEQGYDFSTFF